MGGYSHKHCICVYNDDPIYPKYRCGILVKLIGRFNISDVRFQSQFQSKAYEISSEQPLTTVVQCTHRSQQMLSTWPQHSQLCTSLLSQTQVNTKNDASTLLLDYWGGQSFTHQTCQPRLLRSVDFSTSPLVTN